MKLEPWVERVIAQWLAEQLPGNLTLHFDGAVIQKVERTDVRKRPKEA